MSQPNYEVDDDLPLPPPPPSWCHSTSWHNQQMNSIKFPPPPPEVDYSYSSDINGNQFYHENAESKNQHSLYTNLRPRPIVTVRKN